MKKMNILLFMAKLDMGGIENLYLNVIPRLEDEFNFYIAYYGSGENELEDRFKELGCEIHKLDCNRYTHPVKFVNLIRNYICEKNIAVTHTNVGYSTFYALVAACLERVPIRIAHSHSTEFGNSKNPVNGLFRLLCKISCHFCATTRINIGTLSAQGLFFKNDESLFVPNGINLDRFAYRPESRARIRTDFSIPMDSPVLINVGRLEEVKNHMFLLDVFSECLAILPNAHLFMVGSGTLESEIRKKAEFLGITKKIHITGAVSNPQDFCSAADCLVMPSHHEGLSLAMIEAQANGLVCFTSTNVDAGTKVTNNLEFLPLENGASVWANAIASSFGERRAAPIDSRLELYDARRTAALLGKIYRREIR